MIEVIIFILSILFLCKNTRENYQSGDTKHPKYDYIYNVNYGYVPNTISGDNEELDCCILGIDEPILEFEGKCIAVIYRLNDDDDKLIIVPDGKNYSDQEIKEIIHFQEKYFESEVIR